MRIDNPEQLVNNGIRLAKWIIFFEIMNQFFKKTLFQSEGVEK
jgi:hypothetical protein